MSVDCINFTCLGESHKAVGKVCQDYSYGNIYEDGVAIVVVCDGHGGKRYFRSDIGARLACQVTEEKTRFFIDTVGDSLFKGKPYTANSAIATQINNEQFEKENEIDKSLRQLFSSIIYEWGVRIQDHAEAIPLTEQELSSIEEDWQADFESRTNLEKVYGCTLMAYIQTKDFWLAYHIGDGKCISFNAEGEWSEPIPWDERCFLNKTTSLCDSNAINEFRYCYQGDGNFPVATFLGSDGLDDSFGSEENLANFYAQILKKIVQVSKECVVEEIQTTLPELSAIGSKDDMSVATVFNKEALTQVYPQLILWQIDSVKKSLDKLNERIEKRRIKITELETLVPRTPHQQIEHDFACSDIDRMVAEKAKIIKKINILFQELQGDNFTPYVDENET